MSDSGQTSTLLAYRRLLSYLRPYWGFVAIGIVAGFFCGTSNLGLLSTAPDVIKPIEIGAPAPSNSVASAVAPAEKPKGTVDKLMARARDWGIPLADDSGRMTWQALVISLVALPLLVVLRSLTMYLNRYFMRWVASRVVRDLRDALFNRLQSQSLKFFGKSDVGRLISNCTNDTSVVEHVLSASIADLTRAPFEIVAAGIFVIAFSIQSNLLGLVLLLSLAFPLCIIPIVLLGRRVKRYSHAALGRISELVSRMHENFTGIRVVKAFHTEAVESERFRVMNANYFRSTIRALRAELLMTPMMEGVAILLACVFFVICFAKGVKLYQIIPLGLAGVMAYRPLKLLAQLNANLQRGAAALDRIYAVLDTDTAIREVEHPKAVTRFDDRIVFDHVAFAYSDEGPKVIDGVSFEVRKGHVVALVGETGSGKTTLAYLLARFYDPTAGRITLDGVDLREVEIASLRKLIGVVTQETILFNDTLANNIAYGTPGVSPEQIAEAAKKANAHEFIMGDPAGYERVAGEKGFVLSGGEKQRVAIARAILRNPPILILDEATSALDTVTERLVQEAISRVMKDRTVFAIAHRLSTVKHADLILVIERGRIIERGTHDQLLAAGGVYKRLCDLQFESVTGEG